MPTLPSSLERNGVEKNLIDLISVLNIILRPQRANPAAPLWQIEKNPFKRAASKKRIKKAFERPHAEKVDEWRDIPLCVKRTGAEMGLFAS